MPAPARLERGAFSHFPQGVEGPKTRERSETFLDHFSQATLFLNSQSENERRHMVRACRFELGKVERLGIRERVVALFREVDEEFARDVAAGIGVSLVGPARKPAPKKAARGKTVTASPALSLENQPRKSIKTRKVALLAADGVRAADVDATRTALHGGGAAVEVISFVLGPLRSEEGRPIDVDKTFLTASSVLYDAVYVPGGETSVAALLESDDASDFVHEAYRHAKPVASSGEGYELLADAGVAEVAQGPQAGGAKSKLVARRGVVAAPAGADGAFTEAFVAALAAHRHFERELETGTI
jgi:catalase